MAYIPYSPQNGCVYTLTGPDGTIANFNTDPSTDPNHVGVLTDVSGLDSPELRESAEDLVQADGGWHGNFWFSRRPITLTGIVYGHTTDLIRDTRLDRLRQASAALRGDAVLTWQNKPTGSMPVMRTWVRRQQPLRITGAWNKEFQVSLVSEYAPVFSDTLHTVSVNGGVNSPATALTVENKGNWPTYPIIYVTGQVHNPDLAIGNTVTQEYIRFVAGTQIPSGHVWAFDTLNHTVTNNAGTNMTSYVDFANSDWPTAVKGNNDFRIANGTNFNSVAAIRVDWRDAWA